MALSQRKTTVAVLRGILGPFHGQEARFAILADRSRSWVKKASAGLMPLSERTARVLAHETGVSLEWLLGPADQPAVDSKGQRYDEKYFKWYRARAEEGHQP